AVLATIGRYDTAAHALIDDPELHVYEAVQEARSMNGPPVEWHIAKNNTIAKDTRSPPDGFVVGPTRPIIGADYSDVKGGIRAYDDVTMHLMVPAGTPAGALTVRATVLYQSTVAALVDELDKANTTDMRGQTLQQLWAATGYADPMAIASVEVTI